MRLLSLAMASRVLVFAWIVGSGAALRPIPRGLPRAALSTSARATRPSVVAPLAAASPSVAERAAAAAAADGGGDAPVVAPVTLLAGFLGVGKVRAPLGVIVSCRLNRKRQEE